MEKVAMIASGCSSLGAPVSGQNELAHNAIKSKSAVRFISHSSIG
jgi:hypothetical protein